MYADERRSKWSLATDAQQIDTLLGKLTREHETNYIQANSISCLAAFEIVGFLASKRISHNLIPVDTINVNTFLRVYFGDHFFSLLLFFFFLFFYSLLFSSSFLFLSSSLCFIIIFFVSNIMNHSLLISKIYQTFVITIVTSFITLTCYFSVFNFNKKSNEIDLSSNDD